MFRCKECGEEYETKPDFCDCGNDTFEEIIVESPKKEETKKKKRSFDETYPSLARLKESLDPISVGIFTLCIILSVLSLIFIGNSNKEEVNVVNEIKKNVQTKISDIDEIWDDTPVKIVQEKKNEQTKKVENVEIKVIKLEATPQKSKAQKSTPTKAVAPSSNKKVNSQTKTVQKAQTKAATTKQPAVQKPQNIKNTTNIANTTKNVQLKPVIQEQDKNTTKQVSEADKKAALQELKVYKNSLRNLLFSKINFAQIEGDGIGIVSFKIESNGKLTGKTFVQRSNNEQLDDAIFYSLNTTSSYKAPPSSYKGETLKFKVKFVGGQYEVSLN